MSGVHHDISDKAPVCPCCGAPIAGHVVTCPVCGKVYFSNQAECPQCHHVTGEKVAGQTLGQEAAQAVVQTFEQDSEQKSEPTSEQNKPANAHKNNRIVIMVVVVAALVVCGICYAFYHNAQSDKEQKAYEMAMSSQDADVYRTILQCIQMLLKNMLTQYSRILICLKPLIATGLTP